MERSEHKLFGRTYPESQLNILLVTRDPSHPEKNSGMLGINSHINLRRPPPKQWRTP
jgi:hypothetical protein